MRKILLTSAGFETKTISDIFLSLVGKSPNEITALFIPTAAVFPDAIAVLPKCMDDLLNIGISVANIKVFDLHRSLSVEELSAFDIVYFTGGDPQYLLKRINESGFRNVLLNYVDNGGIYVGVSAGSIVASGNMPDGLGYLKASINVHMEVGSASDVFNNDVITHIDLTNNQAVLIHGATYEIIG
ncbi:MAG: Type 1 glutamine amidotransferase-like domain-containing protein [Eubacteriales bacterium]|nr:Type 1 glutamine amidotransferase-like domain-containing protein [Eubacteriales bacterium]